MLANALVVFGLGQNLVVLAIGQDEYAALNATHEFLDDHTTGGIAEHTAQHLFQFLLRLVKSGEDQHTFSGTKTVRLQHIGWLERFQEGQTFLHVLAIESLIACGGDMVTHHKVFGEVLRAFQHGTSLRGADDGDILRADISLQLIVDALYQWVFRTNHHHVDAFLDAECLDGLEVVGLHGYVLAAVARSGITRCDIQFLTFLTLSDFPGQCMLASATA